MFPVNLKWGHIYESALNKGKPLDNFYYAGIFLELLSKFVQTVCDVAEMKSLEETHHFISESNHLYVFMRIAFWSTTYNRLVK